MCTVTIIPIPPDPGAADEELAGYRLATNRDERRDRQAGQPPRVHRTDAGRALWPIDAQAGGTWVGVSDRGLSLAILSSAPPERPAPPAPERIISRGLIIPRLIDAATPEEFIDRLEAFPLDCFDCFHLVAVDHTGVINSSWDSRALRIARTELGPACYASSGLGDDRVRPRLRLFDEWRRRAPLTPELQDEFHGHAWPDRPEISVRMSREDALTVSTTVVEVRRKADAIDISMTYTAGTEQMNCALAGCEPGFVEKSGERT
ncbi:MAG: hypothetical protein EA376_05795 [Phycisphaeraceae bacterium]|nr:MAG: hypothetical protein EA376_05795 [Phycisphaeraceae bacterium]